MALCTRVAHAELFQRVLQRQRVDDRGQHAHVIARGALDAALAAAQAAEDVAAADHHDHLHAQVAHLADLLRHVAARPADRCPRRVSPPRASPLSFNRIRLYLGCWVFFMAVARGFVTGRARNVKPMAAN